MSYTKKVKAAIDVEFELSSKNPNTLTNDELKKVFKKSWKYQILNAKQVVTVTKNKPVIDLYTRMRNLCRKLDVRWSTYNNSTNYCLSWKRDWHLNYQFYIRIEGVVFNYKTNITQKIKHSSAIFKLIGADNTLFSIQFDANNNAVLEFGPNEVFDAFGFPRPQVAKLNLPKIGTKQFTNEVSKLVEYFKDLISKVPGPTYA